MKTKTETVELETLPGEHIGFLGFDDMEVKQEGDAEASHLFIEGFATTTHKDRTGDVITKEFYVNNIARGDIDKAKTLLLDHSPEKAIGSLIDFAVKKRKGGWGLWVKAQISNAEDVDDVRTKIKEGTLNAFSFRWRGVPDGEEPVNPKEPFGARRIKDGIIIEVSVVSLPANPEAEITRFYEKSLEVLAQPGVGAKEIAGAVIKSLKAEGAIASAGKQDTPAIGKKEEPKGEQELDMDNATIKALVASMTKAQFDALPTGTRKELVEFDSGIETRLENEALKAELKASQDATAKAEKEAKEAKEAAEAKPTAAPAATEPAATEPAATEPKDDDDAKGAKEKPITRGEIQKIVLAAVQAAAGKAPKKSDAGNTKSLGADDGARIKAFSQKKVDPELDEGVVQQRLIGAFIAGNKETHAAIHTMVNDLGQPAADDE